MPCTIRTTHTLIVGCILGACIHDECSAQCLSYSMEVVALPFCGLPNYGIAPYGLNEAGFMTGVYATCSQQGGSFVWTGGPSVAYLNLGSSTSGGSADLNSHLQIIGTKEGPTGHVGFLYERGNTIDIGMLPGSNFAEANAINDAGQICGYANNVLTGPLQAFVWDDGDQFALKLPLGPNAVAYDINASGQVVGWMGVTANPPHYAEGFLWDDGVTIPLGFPKGGLTSEAYAISDNGQVGGVFVLPNAAGTGYIRRGFHWRDGVSTDIGTLPTFTRSTVLGVNNEGRVVGYCDGNLPSRAFIWQDGVMHDLNDLIPPGTNVTLRSAQAINNRGQIACEGRDQTSSFVAVLLTPIPDSPGDLNCDKAVDVDDLLGVINAWGEAGPHPADFTGDQTVNLDDLLIVINHWTL